MKEVLLYMYVDKQDMCANDTTRGSQKQGIKERKKNKNKEDNIKKRVCTFA